VYEKIYIIRKGQFPFIFSVYEKIYIIRKGQFPLYFSEVCLNSDILV